ncbi:hypothetical protein DIPPA_13254 [Diplonema papillatum]|nr:hypothetical protein DIPPA_13254 [Diplonema papillatum]
MSVDKLRARMNEAALRRFDDTWQTTFFPRVETETVIGSPSTLRPEHASLLADNGIARSSTGPGPFASVPFTVLEEKDGALRQRFILWTVDGNRAAHERGYEAHVPLGHVSAYLGASREECGSTRDFKTGFYAIEIPPESRHLFRFADSGGGWWELLRLPMGHSCAPEIMHTLAAVAGGHADYVLPQFAERDVTVDIWVDNIRYAGKRSAVQLATRRLDQTAADCDLTWKPSDSQTAATRYEFIGVDWDHVAHRVAVSRKLRRKLMEARYTLKSSPTMRASELETLGGRLLHASAVAGIFPGSFWFALKFFRRVTNSLNRGARLPSDTVEVSPCVRLSLHEWIDSVLKPRAIPVLQQSPRITAFVDASKKGWGGVLVDSRTMEVTVLGGSWNAAESSLHINELEAIAFNLVILALPVSIKGGRVDVVVDNTTVKGVARKGACLKSAVLNNAVVRGLERVRSLNCALSVRWVRSEGNPADLPSRVPLTMIGADALDSIVLAVRQFLTGVVVDGR